MCIVPFLADLFNTSLRSAIVSSAFKQAKVRPLLKKAGLDPDELK